MRNRRDRRNPNKTVKHIVNRVGHGIPFVPSLIINRYVESIMAKAQELYPAQIVCFLWMGNHYHIITVGRAEHISSFIGYIQGEIAKVVKRLTDIYQTKVWPGRFKEQTLGDGQDVIDLLIYIYTNPVRARLVSSIDEYPGVSSWKMLKSNSYSYYRKFVPVRCAYKVNGSYNSVVKYKELLEESTRSHEFTLNPYIWKNYFADTAELSNLEILKQIEEGVRAIEKEVKAENNFFIGKKSLINSKINKNYKPKKKGRTPYVICRNVRKRKEMINSYKNFVEKCKLIWNSVKEKLKSGIKTIKYPSGAYMPAYALKHVALRY